MIIIPLKTEVWRYFLLLPVLMTDDHFKFYLIKFAYQTWRVASVYKVDWKD